MNKGADFYTKGKSEEVRNSEGIWINSQVFRTAGNQFKKRGYYISDPWDSPAWIEYWSKERDKTINGVTIGGVRITGDHYFYLNYCPILKVENITGTTADKVTGFPDFWDGDYNYFWIRELARHGVFSMLDDEDRKVMIEMGSELQALEIKRLYESLGLVVDIEIDYLKGGYNLIVGKARRRGYSYKAAAIGTRNYFTVPESLTIFGAYDKKYLYPKGIFTKAYNYINFINENTGWVFPADMTNKPGAGHVKGSYVKEINGVNVEKGFKSQIIAPTFKDNPDAARGDDARDVFFEESGAFGTPGLLKRAYKATEDTVMAGSIKTGLITIFGTSGDMEGGTADYADMFSRPLAFGLLPFKNIWDENSIDMQVGFFHPTNWNMEGYYDGQGNSNYEGAKQFELSARKVLIDNGATSTEMQERLQEKPLGPGEAFASVSTNNFPVVELNRQIAKVRGMQLHLKKGKPVEFYRNEGELTTKVILDESVEPIRSYRNEPRSKRSCPVIYEQPMANAPRGLYKIGYDPIRQDDGTSLAGIVVYKSFHRDSMYHSIIVAEYIGRLESPDDIDRIAMNFAEYYNTTIMHENEVVGVKNFFRRIKRLNLLAAQPDLVISKNIKKSKVARVYGCHMTEQLKDGGERYVKDWLLTVLDYDENGNPVTVIDRIYSLRLLEELVAYFRKGNFDLVSALFMCMFQVQEEEIGKEYGSNDEKKNVKKLKSMKRRMYSRH